MSKIDNGVPWAEGRRALWLQDSFDGLPPRWVSAVGTTRELFVDDARKERHRFWEVVGDANDFEWAEDAVTILEPGQCRECYEIDAHTETCARGKRIADNLARGVPAFWAEWVRADAPPATDEAGRPSCARRAVTLYVLVGSSLMAPAGYVESVGRWVWTIGAVEPGKAGHGLGFLALGPDGITLAPWGL